MSYLPKRDQSLGMSAIGSMVPALQRLIWGGKRTLDSEPFEAAG